MIRRGLREKRDFRRHRQFRSVRGYNRPRFSRSRNFETNQAAYTWQALCVLLYRRLTKGWKIFMVFDTIFSTNFIKRYFNTRIF